MALKHRADPFRRTLVIFGACVLSMLIGFWVVGSQLLAAAPAGIYTLADGMAVEDVSFTGDGTQLFGWLAGDSEPDAVVVLLHPAQRDRRAMVDRARFLVDAGYAVLLFDFQAHGESEGRRITYGLREAQDAAAAVRFARNRYPGARVLALGVSLGATSCLLTDPLLDVDGMILESVFPDLETSLSNRLRLRLGRLGHYLAPLFAWQLEKRLHASSEDFWPFSRAPSVRVPVMLIAAAADRRVDSAELLYFYDLFAGRKSIWLVSGAVHQDLHWYARAEYEQRVRAFVDRIVDDAG